jgi:plastocyanin
VTRSSLRIWLRVAALLVLIPIVATMIGDCEEGNESPASPATQPIVPQGNGVVRGVVKFSAPRPAVKVIGAECCPGATPAVDESTVVNDNGTLRNVVVYVKAGPNVASAPDQIGPAVLDQKDCCYAPHVLAVRTDEPVDVTSHDPTLHNVHVLASVNAAQNFSETAVGATHRLAFTASEIIHVKCEVHPWMSAYIIVLDHPFFAVTGKDGTFHIPRLPSGNYTLVAWHEKYGVLEQPFTVDGTKVTDVEFEYKDMANGK